MTLNARIALIVLPFVVAGWLQGQVRMRAGLWENTVTSSGRTVTRNACITPAQEKSSMGSVASMREAIEKALAKSGACKLQEFTVVGATRTELMVCGSTSIKNSTTFHGDSFETTSTSTTAQVVKSSLLKGRRLGDCPIGDPK
jgi:Protein of unknown function (DUF3617)